MSEKDMPANRTEEAAATSTKNAVPADRNQALVIGDSQETRDLVAVDVDRHVDAGTGHHVLALDARGGAAALQVQYFTVRLDDVGMLDLAEDGVATAHFDIVVDIAIIAVKV